MTENKKIRTVIIDRDIEHADWLRGFGWGLPVNVDELLGVIGSTKADVEKFMKLPAARAMPVEVRRELVKRKLISK